MANEVDCPFCPPPTERVFFEGPLTTGFWDAFAVSPGHALLVPKRHVATWFEATMLERVALVEAIDNAKQEIERLYRPDGFNIGINAGEAAGQTVFHLHVHVIPRYRGDSPNPRGGVRAVVPGKADYFDVVRDADPSYRSAGVRNLVTGGGDPLLPHLKRHLASAHSVDVAVAFVLPSGLALLWDHLSEMLERGGRVRVLTGDYLDATDPDALVRLLDLEGDSPGQVERRVFCTSGDGVGLATAFHPKAYLFRERSGETVAFVGSSNLSRSALVEGVEWNYRILPGSGGDACEEIQQAFDRLFRDPRTVELTPEWIEQYRARRIAVERVPRKEVLPVPLEETLEVPEPHAVQKEALAALAAARSEGKRAGLVVLATGLGKTWLSAFDSRSFSRVLFVAHREEILRQAMTTYRRIRPHDYLGHYTGDEKHPHAQVVFASVQTLSRKQHLERFSPGHFDYIVVDEFHHASAATYRKLIGHFRPDFLLGLTATPERSDGADLLDLCDGNLVYRCDLVDGIRQELLCPFHYFGVPDLVDYQNIPWRSTRFDEEALTAAVATRARAENAYEQLERRGGKRVLAFCASQKHADFMARFFAEKGKRVAAVHSGDSSDPRAESLEKLAAGELDIVCAVDMFNEGVDLPELDTVLMLRPTESRILWMQQFGRGLRRSDPEKRLRVIDYIGNHRVFLLKPQTLFGLPAGDAHIQALLEKVRAGGLDLPPGCEVTYDLATVDILRKLLRVGRGAADALESYVLDFVALHGVRPTALEVYRDGFDPRGVRPSHRSWFAFLEKVGVLSPPDRDAALANQEFLGHLETTPMSRSYKMVVLLAALNEDAFPGAIGLGRLVAAVRNLGAHRPEVAKDFRETWTSDTSLRRHLVMNPIEAWTGGAGTGGTVHFRYAEEELSSTMPVLEGHRSVLQEMARELAEWRLAEYFARSSVRQEEVVVRVSQANGDSVLSPLPRESSPDLPIGWADLEIEGRTYRANFEATQVSTIQRHGSERNELGGFLRQWFGPDAGAPGTRHQVGLVRNGATWAMSPVGVGALVAVPWKSYSREQIPGLFGMPFVGPVWQQGFVRRDKRTFLLVTLDKSNAAPEHKYEDRFLSERTFQWQSQNQTAQASIAGQSIRDHERLGIEVHLFVRPRSKQRNSKACPFIYCGRVEFVDWQGDRPITVRWRLREAVPSRLHEELRVPTSHEQAFQP